MSLRSQRAERNQHKPQKTVDLIGTLLFVTHDAVAFAHQGERFMIAIDDILDIADSQAVIPNKFRKGRIVWIRFRANARLAPFDPITVAQFDSAVPYAINRPSQTSENKRPWVSAWE